MTKKAPNLLDDFGLEESTSEAVAAQIPGAEGPPVRQLNFRVSERFWREFHDYCRLNDRAKVDVLREAFTLYRRYHGR
jgi:hypothetical protein